MRQDTVIKFVRIAESNKIAIDNILNEVGEISKNKLINGLIKHGVDNIHKYSINQLINAEELLYKKGDDGTELTLRLYKSYHDAIEKLELQSIVYNRLINVLIYIGCDMFDGMEHEVIKKSLKG